MLVKFYLGQNEDYRLGDSIALRNWSIKIGGEGQYM